MTDSETEEIKKRISEKTVYTPSDLDLDKLEVWLNGYKTCMDSAIEILNEFKSGR